jgi:uncharacterized LabA/DUF88 family protein
MGNRVIAYFDGFNYYEGIKSKWGRKYYWQDIVKFVELFLKPYHKLERVRYFTAIQKDEDKAERQDRFFQANRVNPLFNYVLGQFYRRERWRNIDCNGKKVSRKILFWEEKKSDVALASYMIRDVVKNNCDVIFLFTADSDITPAIDVIKEIAGRIKIFVFFPPGNFSYDLNNCADKRIYLQDHEIKFQNSQFPDEITLPNGYVIKRPEKWR